MDPGQMLPGTKNGAPQRRILTRFEVLPIIEERMCKAQFSRNRAGPRGRNTAGWALATSLAILVTSQLAMPTPAAAQSHATRRKKYAAAASHSPRVASTAEDELETLARALSGPQASSAYAKLNLYQARHRGTAQGRMAALALGHDNFAKGQFDAAQVWFSAARTDSLLGDYALYWDAESLRAQKRNQMAMDTFDELRGRFPGSVLTERALAAEAQVGLEMNAPGRALAALSGVEDIEKKPALLILRGEAREKTGALEGAAQDDATVRYRFPLTSEAEVAGVRLADLRERLGDSFPEISLKLRLERADALYQARRWRDAHDEYQQAVPLATGETAELARLRMARASVAMGAPLSELGQLHLATPRLDALRLYYLAKAWRTKKNESEMLGYVEQAVSRAPASEAAEKALFLAGNAYWADSNRTQACMYYQRLTLGFPDARDAMAAAAAWRVAWTAYLNREQGAEPAIERYIQSFPASGNIDDAVYFLGRSEERMLNLPRARACFRELSTHFPETYFGRLGKERLRKLGAGPEENPDVLAMVAPPPAAPTLTEHDPPTASQHVLKAEALEEIALDSQAEEELRAEYQASHQPELLLEIAEAADRAGAYGKAIVTMRELYPQLEAHAFSQLPLRVWRTAYPLPYAGEVRAEAERAGVDPMLVAGLARQESAFQAGARSRANAFGLMQLLPSTARKLARLNHLRYSKARLIDPEYNLRLGSLYLAGLLVRQGGREAALAAYNAGENRVEEWQASGNFTEPAEFVESIPFTETREYVQIVLRNAAIYERLYGGGE